MRAIFIICVSASFVVPIGVASIVSGAVVPGVALYALWVLAIYLTLSEQEE